MTGTHSPADEIFVPSWLDLHDRRRRQPIPTLSVLSGPLGLGVHYWRQWAAARQQPVVQLSATDPASVVAGWAETFARQRNLKDDAFTYLSVRTGEPAAALRAKLTSATRYDLEQYWDTSPLGRDRSATALACRELLQQYLTGESFTPEQVVAQINAGLPEKGSSWHHVVAALSGLAPPDALPALLLVPDDPGGVPAGWVEAATRQLAALVARVPQLPAGVAVPTNLLRHYLETAPESHARALVREGIIPVAGLSEGQARQRLRAMGVPAETLSGPVQRLTADGASEELVRSFGEAVRRLEKIQEVEAADQARSAAERFLYGRLESLPETAGRFQLNASLDFRFGTRDAEVDLFARDFRLAIEIDGYYHFQDRENYRRDRHKDWELQRRGYLVLRFLAEDVVPRMEIMLDTILAAVAHARQRPTPPRAPTP